MNELGQDMGRKRVLIIEDEPDFAAILKYRLQQKGLETVIAADGESGLDQASRCRPDLIVLDLMLPKMPGLEVCRSIRGNPAMGHVPICIMSALDPASYRVEGFMVGADGYFSKTNQLPDLLRRVDELFDQTDAAAGAATSTTTEFVTSLAEEMLAELATKPWHENRQFIPLSES